MAESRVGADAIGVVDPRGRQSLVEAVPIEDAPEDELAEKIVRTFVGICEHKVTHPLVIKLSKGSVGDASAAGKLGRSFTRLLYARLGRRGRAKVSMLRIELITIQLAGMAIARYGLRLEPMASLPREELVSLLIPQVSAALRSETSEVVHLDTRSPVQSPALDPRQIYKVTGRPG